MHEVGILSAILKKVDAIMEEEGLTEVETIVLDVGELSGVEPHYMTECFPAATYKTKFKDTKLEMNVVPGTVKCLSCGKEFNACEYNLVCPGCGETRRFEPLTGRELMIREIRGK